MGFPDELLQQFANDDEIVLELALPGQPTIAVPVWVVVVDGEVVVRSYTGLGARWYRRAVRHPEQSIRVRTRSVPVTFEVIRTTTAIDDEYLEKYRRFDYAGSMVKPLATAATLRVNAR